MFSPGTAEEGGNVGWEWDASGYDDDGGGGGYNDGEATKEVSAFGKWRGWGGHRLDTRTPPTLR